MNENHLFQGMGLTLVDSIKDLYEIMPEELVHLLDKHNLFQSLLTSSLKQTPKECSGQWPTASGM